MHKSGRHIFIGITGCALDSSKPDRLIAYYIEAVERAGGIPIILPPINIGFALGWIELIDGLIIGHKTDIDPVHYQGQPHPEMYNVNPTSDAVEIKLVHLAIEHQRPVLGINRGMQAINVAMGGTLHAHIRDLKGDMLEHRGPEGELVKHSVNISGNSKLAGLLGRHAKVLSCHHQAIDHVGSNLKVTATSEDGLIEAIEMINNKNTIGVQWHPELAARHNRQQQGIFDWLVDRAEYCASKKNKPVMSADHRAHDQHESYPLRSNVGS